MGWYGIWNLEYTGNNQKKFVNVAKLVIGNFKKRFEIVEGTNELEAVKKIAWYSADLDIETILSYLEDGDKIYVRIDGETHPYDDKGEVLEWEEQEYTKENGKVHMECKYVDCDRYQTDRHGIQEAFIYDLTISPEKANLAALKNGDADTLDTYLQWIVEEMGEDEEMMPIIQDFMQKIMNVTKEQVLKREGTIDKQAWEHFNSVKANFESLESTKAYLAQIRAKLPPKEQKPKIELPALFANMSREDINQLGGKATLLKLCNKVGEEEAKDIITMLGYDLNSKNKPKAKKKSSLAEIREAEETNQKIKQAINRYLIGVIKQKYPDLSKENEAIFLERISSTIDREIEQGSMFYSNGFGPRGLHCDNRPSPELEYAFMGMDFGPEWPEYRMQAAAHLTFPFKMSIDVEAGRCVRTTDGMDWQYLYMTEEYKQKELTAVTMEIMEQESKIPEEIKAGFEQEYQSVIEMLNQRRDGLVAKQEAKQAILEEAKKVQEKVDKLLDTYASRTAELQARTDLSDAQKAAEKKKIIAEIVEARKLVRGDKTREKLSKLGEQYGYEELADFDKEHAKNFHKEEWMEYRYLMYSEEEYKRIYDEYRKAHPAEFGFPDTRNIPRDLNYLYQRRNAIKQYEQSQEKRMQKEEGQVEQNAIPQLTPEQIKFTLAAAMAYVEHMKERNIIDRYGLRPETEQMLTERIFHYLEEHSSNLTNPDFLVEFENGVMRQIADSVGKRREYGMFATGMGHIKSRRPSIQVSEGLVYYEDAILDDVKIMYATPEAIQAKIDSLGSRAMFMQDNGEEQYFIKKLIKQKEAFENYQRVLQGKPIKEESLEELEQTKQYLEALDAKTQELLEQQNRQEKGAIPKSVEGVGIED